MSIKKTSFRIIFLSKKSVYRALMHIYQLSLLLANQINNLKIINSTTLLFYMVHKYYQFCDLQTHLFIS